MKETKVLILNAVIWITFYAVIWYKENKRKWVFVPCDTPSESVEMLVTFIKSNKGTEYRLTVKGNQFGFEWR